MDDAEAPDRALARRQRRDDFREVVKAMKNTLPLGPPAAEGGTNTRIINITESPEFLRFLERPDVEEVYALIRNWPNSADQTIFLILWDTPGATLMKQHLVQSPSLPKLWGRKEPFTVEEIEQLERSGIVFQVDM